MTRILSVKNGCKPKSLKFINIYLSLYQPKNLNKHEPARNLRA